MDEPPTLLARRRQRLLRGVLGLTVLVALATTQVNRNVAWMVQVQPGETTMKAFTGRSNNTIYSSYQNSSPSSACLSEYLSRAAKQSPSQTFSIGVEGDHCAPERHQQPPKSHNTETSMHVNRPEKCGYPNEKTPEQKIRPIRFIHVWSPYVVRRNGSKDNPYFPLDLTQYVTVQSMIRAKQEVSTSENIHVTTHCAVLEEDLNLLFPESKRFSDGLAATSDSSDEGGRATNAFSSRTNMIDKKRKQTRKGEKKHRKIPEKSDSFFSLPSLCDKKIVLTRSTATQYPTMEPTTQALPFIQDILKGSLDIADERTAAENISNDASPSTSFDYMIYTNADISLTKNFYRNLAESLRKSQPHRLASSVTTKVRPPENATMSEFTSSANMSTIFPPTSSPYHSWPWDSMTINRKTIWNQQLTNLTEIDEILEERRGKRTWEDHPGTDCFVMHKTLVQSIHLHDLFLGHPPMAKNLKYIISEYMAFSYQKIPSQASLTFHLGDDHEWQKEPQRMRISDADNRAVQQCQHPNLVFPNGQFRHKIQVSPAFSKQFLKWTPQLLQNTVNCGALFDDRKWCFESEGKQLSIPNYVQKGFEDRYVRLSTKEQRPLTWNFQKFRKSGLEVHMRTEAATNIAQDHVKASGRRQSNAVIISEEDGKLVYKGAGRTTDNHGKID